MAVVYSTKINGVRVKTEGGMVDVVKEVDINLTGVDGTCEFTLPVTVKMPAADPESFTAFGDLTEAQIVSWVEAQEDMLQPRKEHIAILLEREVEKAAAHSKPLPWSQEPPPVDAGVPLANPEE